MRARPIPSSPTANCGRTVAVGPSVRAWGKDVRRVGHRGCGRDRPYARGAGTTERVVLGDGGGPSVRAWGRGYLTSVKRTGGPLRASVSTTTGGGFTRLGAGRFASPPSGGDVAAARAAMLIAAL